MKLKQVFCRHRYWEMLADREQKITKLGYYFICLRCGKIDILDKKEINFRQGGS